MRTLFDYKAGLDWIMVTTCRRAPSGQGTGSLTQRLRKYDFKIKGRTANFVVWDTPGWTKNDYRDGVMNLILNGSVRDRIDIAKALPTTPTYKV